ncbi:cytochrome P450 [Suillus discolor]|uniref:Cytochrome P450 n=1 Tax=Suillus discolor TaxID=1912936 RepID=A0A9P7JTT3_9AGAM|nr:cytochrome P450 [Suillus discolor]KAG2107399.1 cytochrome P450 [Suillus discolor]
MFTLGLCSCFCTLALASWAFARSRRLPLPPGPQGTFWFGNEQILPWEHPWKEFVNWSKIFGPLIYLYAFGRDILIVNEASAATDLLETKSTLYARRPTWSMVALTGRQDNIAFMDHTDRQKKARVILQSAFNPKAQRSWGPVLEEETTSLMLQIAQSPELFKQHIRRYLGSFITRFTYGTKVEDHELKLGDEISLHTQQALRPGRWLADIVPLVLYLPDWFPGMAFKPWARDARTKFMEYTARPFRQARSSILDGTEMRGMVPDALSDIIAGTSKYKEEELISAASSIYTAAVETTYAVFMDFLILMMAHQDVQERAYREIMSVTESTRQPLLSDMAALPYVDAVIREVHRFNPVTPMIPRSPMETDSYKGYRIPQDTWVMFNIWAMTHDASIYRDPDEFMPERHLPLGHESSAKDPRDFTFGFGKRICPGMSLANLQMFIFVSQFLATFEIRPPLKEDGNEEEVVLEYTSSFVRFAAVLCTYYYVLLMTT